MTPPDTPTPEQLIALLADEQRIQAESKARTDQYKALLSDYYLDNLIGDNVTIPGFSLTRVSRTTESFPDPVLAQIETLKEQARHDELVTTKTTYSWTLRKLKSCQP